MNPEMDQCWQDIIREDKRALERLYKQAFPILLHYAESIVGQTQLAEEVVQDVMLKLWQNRSLIVVQGSIKSYLLRSVHNHALNALRHRKTLNQKVNQTSPEEIWQFITNHYNLDEDIISQLYTEETNHLILNAIEQLPEQCQRVFKMSRFEDMTVEEIAEKLNLSEHTIKTHIYRALQKISDVLKKEL